MLEYIILMFYIKGDMYMVMQCRNCKRKMDLVEFLAYASSCLIKIVIVPTVVPLLIECIKEYILSVTRGPIGCGMAGIANSFSIACPKCKKFNQTWDPALEEEEKRKSVSCGENITI